MPEDQNIEWKESWRDEYLKWVCGFANASGGKIVIGKTDSGEVLGLKDYKRLLEDIPNKIQNYLGIVCDINLLDIEGKYLIEIVVHPYDIAISYQGKYHYRSGSTKQELKGSVLNSFLLKKAGKTWDDIVESRATIKDIDLLAVEDFKKGALDSKRLPFIKEESSLEGLLDNLLLIEDNKLKRSAILLFGKFPHRFYINAYVKIGRFGKTDDDLKYQEVVEGSIFGLAERVLQVLDQKFLISPISYEGLQRIEKWEYPYKAIREAIINSIVHKDYFGSPIQISVYEDKLIIWNEGKLPDGMEVSDLKKKHSSRPYNPILAGVFFKGGLIEAWGRGTISIIKECQKAGLPEPEFKAEFGGISVTLYKDKYSEKCLIDLGLNDRQVKAVEYVKNNGQIINREYQEINDVSDRTALRDLDQLIELDVFEKFGQKKGTKYKLKYGG
ncbi:MAG: putative DNA binding domain-containing protein [Flavobacteriaceae bacterium]|nr:putative DNA binding domain-containing protein [Flavobacteriaceae bacterium]